MSVLLLLSVCVISFLKPVWGFALLILVTSTLFHLSQYITVSIPIGYIGPQEAILCSMILGVFFMKMRRYGEKVKEKNRPVETDDELFTKKVLLSAIIPYVLWQALCTLRVVIITEDLQHFKFAVRFILDGILPWSIVWILWQIRHHAHRVFQISLFLALMTSVAHILLQITDYRPLMETAYWRQSVDEYWFVYAMRLLWLDTHQFVRGLPQGIILILFFTVVSFIKSLLETSWTKIYYTLTIIFLFAIIITFTRSLVFSIVMGFLIAICYALYFGVLDLHAKTRVVKFQIVLVFLVLMYGIVNPFFLDFWQDRFAALVSTADMKIFSDENPARGLDNIAAIDAIKDSPVWGHGISRYPDEYSYRPVPATDIHPLLQLGIVGGLPAILLMLRLLFLITWKFSARIKKGGMFMRRASIPYLSILAMCAFVVNLIGAGGTLMGTGLTAMAIFIGLLAATFTSVGTSKEGLNR